MPLSREEVEHVARLAHIKLRPEEIELLAVQLSSVVDHVARLERLDLTGVEPTSHAVPLSDVMRDDEIAPSWPVAAVLANAPRRWEEYFEVQAVLD